jgi:PD-(D/E)XK endonuclease
MSTLTPVPTPVALAPLTPSQKGAAAEAEIAAAAVRLGLVVLRPLGEGGRYDLMIDAGRCLLRVQCRWATRRGEVLTAHISTCRRTPRGYVRSTYSKDEVDAVALFSPDTERCYLIPIREIEARSTVQLRLSATRNSQALGVRWAAGYDFAAVLQRIITSTAQPTRGGPALPAVG